MTDYSSFYDRFITKIYCTADALGYEAVGRVRERLPETPFQVVSGKEEIAPEDLSVKTLFITAEKGRNVGACPGSKGRLCCNYLTVDLYEGCPIACTYCILQSYLNFPPITVNVAVDAIWNDIAAIISMNPETPLRIGTGETGDSLFFDPLFELSGELVKRCAPYKEVSLELKTKTHFVDHLLEIDRKGSAVIGFSLNPDKIARKEEGFASTLDERLDAAARAAAHGYALSFHFDPIIHVPDWEELYTQTAARLEIFPSNRIAWISLGTMRYPRELKHCLAQRPYLFDEFILCGDGKYRYLQPLRETMYKKMRSLIGKYTDAPVYLCMESPAIWMNVFKKMPAKNPQLCAIFNTINLGKTDRATEKLN